MATKEQMDEYRLELLRERVRVEAEISRSLWRLLALLESCVRHSPWAAQIMAGVYASEGDQREREEF
jgi:hypothetical protein